MHCPKPWDWDRVQAKIQEAHPEWNPKEWHQCKEETCIALEDGFGRPGFSGKDFWLKKGYTITTAEKYLKEGGEEVEFEIGDEIRCISITGITKKYQDETNIGIGGDYIVSHVYHDNTMGLYDVDTIVEKKDFKLKNKDNNMKENNIDPKVLKVFGKEKGNLGELAIIDRHYNLGMLEEILMDKYKKETREACKDAETKLQEEQED